MEERKILTPQSVQQDLDALGQYKTADVDRLIRRYVKEQADAAPLREHILTEQQFHRINRCKEKKAGCIDTNS